MKKQLEKHVDNETNTYDEITFSEIVFLETTLQTLRKELYKQHFCVYDFVHHTPARQDGETLPQCRLHYQLRYFTLVEFGLMELTRDDSVYFIPLL